MVRIENDRKTISEQILCKGVEVLNSRGVGKLFSCPSINYIQKIRRRDNYYINERFIIHYIFIF